MVKSVPLNTVAGTEVSCTESLNRRVRPTGVSGGAVGHDDLMIFIDPVIGRLVLWRPRMVAPSPSRRDGRRQVVPPHVVAYRGGVVASALACVEQKGPQA
jgi:hypothetical protein